MQRQQSHGAAAYRVNEPIKITYYNLIDTSSLAGIKSKEDIYIDSLLALVNICIIKDEEFKNNKR